MENFKEELLKLLTENARYSFKELASMLSKTEAEVEKAVIEMEKDGTIIKYATIVNNEVFKNKVEALIEVKVAPQKLKGFDSCAEEIYNFPEVRSLYLMSGGFDLALFIEGETLVDIAKFVSEKLSTIDGITSVATHFILKKYKVEGQLTVKNEDRRKEIF
ncbi:MAG: Lrp/AsnC family transcriptional regulator [Firmicutes bacterium]|nr:Lrp/AsnC family transcriptional regulator [Candidatus Caballimonas caccae]